MTDLEITRLCAEAMGLDSIVTRKKGSYFCGGVLSEPAGVWFDTAYGEKPGSHQGKFYNPLHDDAQAMALVKALKMSVNTGDGPWNVSWGECEVFNANLNRAICECVVKMQQAKAAIEV